MEHAPLPRLARVSLVLDVLLSLGALGGGTLFVLDPTGGRMGMAPEAIARTPFSDYRQAGVLLLLVHGLGPWVAVFAELRRRWWAGWAHLVVAGALLVWMAVQAVTMGISAPVQGVMIGQGLVMAGVAAARLAGR